MDELTALVRSAAGGDVSALTAIVERFEDMAVGYAYSILGDFHTAEDAAQEAFVDVFRSLASLRDAAAFPAWFKKVLYYRCARFCRKRLHQIEPIETAESPALSTASAEADVLSRADRESIRRAVLDLPEPERAVVVLYYMGDYSQKDVAAFLGLPVSTVNNRLHASRIRMKEGLLPMMKDSFSDIRPSKSARFRRRVIGGVMRVGYRETQYQMLTPFGGSLVAALRAMGEEVDYSYIMGVSGMAFRMARRDWSDLGNSDIMHMYPDPFAAVRRGLAAAGHDYSLRLCEGSCLKRWDRDPVDHWGWADRPAAPGVPPRVTEPQARQEIRDSIDLGRPVLAFGVWGPPECCVITGYDLDGETLIGWNYFQNDPCFGSMEAEPTGYFRKSSWYDATPVYVVLGAKGERQPRRHVYLDALHWLVELARTPVAADHRAGLAAYAEWEKQLGEDFSGLDLNQLQERLICHCDGLQMVAERQHGAKFLRTMAADEPELAPELLQAADLYEKVASFGGEIWKHVSWNEDGFRKMADPAVRAVLAGHIREAREMEARAVGLIECLLGRVG